MYNLDTQKFMLIFLKKLIKFEILTKKYICKIIKGIPNLSKLTIEIGLWRSLQSISYT